MFSRRRGAFFFLVLGLGTAAFFWWKGCGPASYTNYPPRSPGKIWIAFGDSLTEGVGASEGRDYPRLLSERLQVKILNFGKVGDTTADGLQRLREAVRLRPRVVLLCLGGNDGLRQLPPEETFRNLAAIIDGFHESGAFVVLIGVRSATVRDRYHAMFKSLARDKGCFFVPNILSGVLGSPNLMADYIHPNDEGYAYIAARLEKLLLPLMDDLAP